MGLQGKATIAGYVGRSRSANRRANRSPGSAVGDAGADGCATPGIAERGRRAGHLRGSRQACSRRRRWQVSRGGVELRRARVDSAAPVPPAPCARAAASSSASPGRRLCVPSRPLGPSSGPPPFPYGASSNARLPGRVRHPPAAIAQNCGYAQIANLYGARYGYDPRACEDRGRPARQRVHEHALHGKPLTIERCWPAR
jgi:hypothetical protein